MFKSFTGINIQYPISRDILDGKKCIETRTYPIPEKYLNQEMVFIETPGKSGNFKSRAVGIIVFTKCYKYESKKEFYDEKDKHLVTPDSEWAWRDRPKYGWKLEVVKRFPDLLEIKKRKGIKYTNNIMIPEKFLI